MNNHTTVATDGACIGNPGPTGWAWVRDDGAWESGAQRHGTNNVGELMGLISALEAHEGVPNLRIECDSQYAVNVATGWAKDWAANYWMNSSGKPVKNPELVKELMRLVDSAAPGLEIVWVRGHNGHLLNEWADNRAVVASKQARDGDETVRGTDCGDAPINLSEQPPRSKSDQGYPSKKQKRRRKNLLNLTQIGAEFNISAIQMGRVLDHQEFRDPETKLPTQKGLHYAVVSKNGKYTQVLWKPELLEVLKNDCAR